MGGKMVGEDHLHADTGLIQHVGYHGPGQSHFNLLRFPRNQGSYQV